jgi:hypothetical protein
MADIGVMNIVISSSQAFRVKTDSEMPILQRYSDRATVKSRRKRIGLPAALAISATLSF